MNQTNLHQLDSMICRCIRHSCRLPYNTCLYTMLTLCDVPGAIDLQHGTIVAMCKSIQNNNNPFNKHIVLVNNELSVNNIPNAEQQQLQLIQVMLADPIHHASIALSIRGKQLMDQIYMDDGQGYILSTI